MRGNRFIKTNRSAGIDGIPAEFIKACKHPLRMDALEAYVEVTVPHQRNIWVMVMCVTSHEICTGPGVGVTKPISSVPLFSQMFCIVKTHFNC